MRPTGTCPDCGKPITLQPTGWWSHDGMPEGCWRLSLDGPNVEEDDDPLPYKVGINGVTGYTGEFATHDEAATFIDATYQPAAVAAGHFYIDGPERTTEEAS